MVFPMATIFIAALVATPIALLVVDLFRGHRHHLNG
jgi:hypothetical protein